jgi:hypothetical protein
MSTDFKKFVEFFCIFKYNNPIIDNPFGFRNFRYEHFGTSVQAIQLYESGSFHIVVSDPDDFVVFKYPISKTKRNCESSGRI